MEVLQEEVTYATEEVERLTKVLDEQNSLLQASQEQTAQKEAVIHQLEQKVKSPRQSRPKILKFRFNAFLRQRLFCSRSNNNMMLLKKRSEIEVWNIFPSWRALLNHYLK